MIEVDDDYDSASEASENGRPTSPPILARTPTRVSPAQPSSSPRHQQQSGLRLLLANAAKTNENHIDSDIEQKEDTETKTEAQRGLRRVERQDSLQSVLEINESSVMFASAPLLQMKEAELPKGLVFGFLDDCAVSRKAFQATLKTSLYGSDDSFIRGSTITEARNFADEVKTRRPDIVVLDFCLDFEVSSGVFQSIKGTEIAKEIRQKGYEGCIIMQSEQDGLSNKVDFEIIDGITGKQKATKAFATARAVALVRRRNKISGGLPMPSSTHSSCNSRADSSFSFDMEDPEVRRTTLDEDSGN